MFFFCVREKKLVFFILFTQQIYGDLFATILYTQLNVENENNYSHFPFRSPFCRRCFSRLTHIHVNVFELCFFFF